METQNTPNNQQTPQQNVQYVVVNNNPAAKQRVVYILLAIFLGGLGIHNFYIGRTGAGVAQLLISLLSFGFLSLISWIWAIIDICVVTTDSNGNPLV